MLEMKRRRWSAASPPSRRTTKPGCQEASSNKTNTSSAWRCLSTTLEYADLKDADLVIEAVFEDIGVKRQGVQSSWTRCASPAPSPATPRRWTSTRSPLHRPRKDVVGLHFFSPANVMKLLEVVRGDKTAKDVLATVMAVAKKIKKTAVVSGVCDGFIGNRMIEQYGRQAVSCSMRRTPQQVDKAIEVRLCHGAVPHGRSGRQRHQLGHPQAPLHRAARHSYSKTADLLCEKGRFGQKTGAGWYDYRPGEARRHPQRRGRAR